MKNYTKVVLLIDTSTSMGDWREEAQKGIDIFIKGQAEDECETELTIVDFNTTVDVKVDSMKLSKNIFPSYKLQPRGSTALYDAICKTINETGEKLSSLNENDRPNKVVFVIMTDGDENSSRFYNRQAAKDSITHQEQKYNWKFIYLGANQDAFQVGNAVGFNPIRTSNYSVEKFSNAMIATNNSMARYKRGISDLTYTNEEKESMNG